MIPIAKPNLGQEEVQAAQEVILSGWVSQGPKVAEFEKAFAHFAGADYACAVSNCTTGLHLALLAVGVKPGDIVVTVSHSFITTANVIRYCGAEPLFVDIDLNTFNMAPDALGKTLAGAVSGPRIAAILVVHQIGMPADLKSILKIAKEYDVPVVEDAACASGSEISLDDGVTFERIGRPHGDIACFSFHPRKVLTTGEGGMITTRYEHYDHACRLLRGQAMSVSDLDRHKAGQIIFESYPKVGYNYRMTDIQAAIGIEQLKKLPSMVKRRRDIAERYREGLRDVTWLHLPVEPAYARTNWQSFAIRLCSNAPRPQKDFMQYLLDNGVTTRPGIMNAHQERPYAGRMESLDCSEEARGTGVLLPIFSSMTDDEMQTVMDVIRSA